MRYQAIIFDLDGVICRTDQYHYLAWKQVADELGIPFDEQVNERLRGVTVWPASISSSNGITAQ